MKTISRRNFIKNSSVFGGALLLAPTISAKRWARMNMPQEGYFQEEFGIDDELCHKLLSKAMSTGGDFADIYVEHTIANWLIVEDGKVNQSYSDIKLGVGIRTVKGQQIGYGFTQILTEESMLSAAATAATLVSDSAKTVSGNFKLLNSSNFYPINTADLDVPMGTKLPLVKRVNERCFELSDKIVKVNAGLFDSLKRIMVVTSDGTKAEDIQPSNFLFASVTAKDGDKTEKAWHNLGGKHEFAYYTTDIANKVAEKAVANVLTLFDAKQPPAGEMPVVLGPGVTGILLHEAIGHGMEADFNRKKISTYSTMLGKKVAEPFVTIIDDGTIPNQLGSINIDDEGTPGKKTVLVENGILKSYLHDRISAKHYGVETTGNGRRESFEHYPVPRMRNTYMLGGEASVEDVIKTAKNGVYVESVSNGQVKIGEGDFAFYVSQGRLIEDGKLTTPIKDVNIMGNGPKMLANITMAANDLKINDGGAGMCGKDGQGVPTSYGLPTCLIKSMTVGGREQKGGKS
ncbi:MAG: TldD/PmbA family protein [Proteobacteria bacterium]|nr:TldD/PmbA family protein [Pseudomonadota bacterium]